MTRQTFTVDNISGYRLTRGSLLILGVAVVLIAPNIFYPGFLMKAMCFAMFAAAFNLLFGFGGMLSFGHAAYFGAGAYICGHAAKVWGFSPELAILTGVSVAASLGLVFGWLAIRRQGIYFAMVTLSLAQMVYFVALQAPFTGGEDGLQSVPRGMLFGTIDLSHGLNMYWLVSLVFVGVLLLIRRLVRSPFGQLLQAIRDNEDRASSLGYNVSRHKLLTFVISAAICGLAGAMKVLVFQLASLTDVLWAMSGEPILMTLLGGAGTFSGPLLGAFIIISMQTYLAIFGGWVTIIQGAIFVLCVLMFRGGIIGSATALYKRHRYKSFFEKL